MGVLIAVGAVVGAFVWGFNMGHRAGYKLANDAHVEAWMRRQR